MKRIPILVAYIALSSVAAAQGAPASVMRSYPVGDLLEPLPAKAEKAAAAAKDERGPGVDYNEAKPLVEPKTVRGTFVSVAARTSAVGLQRFLAGLISPGLTDADSLDGFKGTLLLRASVAQHAWVSSVLDLNRGRRQAEIRVEGVLVRLSAGQFSKSLQPVLGTQNIGVLNAERHKVVLALLPQGELQPLGLAAVPALGVARWTRGDSTEYQKDTEIEIETATAKLIPLLGELRSGVRLECLAGFVEDEIVGLDLSGQVEDVRRPIKRIKIAASLRGSAGREDSGFLPEKSNDRERGVVRLRSGEAAWMVMRLASGDRVVVLLSVQVKL